MAARTKDAPDTEIIETFHDLVNMTPHSLETWLKSDESRSVGIKASAGRESTGHQSGRNIIKLLGKKRSEYTAEDYKQMHRVVGYIKRHLAQRPDGDVSGTRWAYSLKNWGHDPSKA